MLIGAGLVMYAAWVGGTMIGTLVGEGLGDPSKLGLDAAFPALFLALLVPQVRSRRAVWASLLGAAIALALTPFAPAGVPIVAASAACLLGLRRGPAEEAMRGEPPEEAPA
jgi:predicted branched-subunit amino acid permease